MNNACKVEEMEQPTFKDILMELNRLKLENECLKADKQQLTKERDEFKEGFKILHNMIEEKDNNEEFLNNDNADGGYSEDEFKALAKGYADFGY